MVSIYFDKDWSISPPTKEIKMAYDDFAIVVPERYPFYIITDSNYWKEPFYEGEENLPQIYSANKFPKDLSSEHKHCPSGEVDTKYNANSARTHQVLPHICFEEMVQMW